MWQGIATMEMGESARTLRNILEQTLSWRTTFHHLEDATASRVILSSADLRCLVLDPRISPSLGLQVIPWEIQRLVWIGHHPLGDPLLLIRRSRRTPNCVRILGLRWLVESVQKVSQ